MSNRKRPSRQWLMLKQFVFGLYCLVFGHSPGRKVDYVHGRKVRRCKRCDRKCHSSRGLFHRKSRRKGGRRRGDEATL